MLSKNTGKAIREHIDGVISREERRIIGAATFDLYYGPTGEHEPDGDGWAYPGFETACDVIAGIDWPDLWTDDDGDYVAEDRMYEEDDDLNVKIDAATVRGVYLGQLAEYVK